jgi:outer membrane lipase/esterase
MMMKIKKRVLPALLLSLFAGLGATGANAQSQFSGFYAFGDSLSDVGYYRGFLAGAGVPAPLVAIMGRYTTNPGPIWAELIAQHYGYSATPSNASGGNVFAQGGARVNQSPGVSTPPGQAQRPISTQVDEFLARGAVDNRALYSMWGGANDVFFNLGAFSAGGITQAQLQTNVLAAATAEIGQIRRFTDAGARYILVFGLPNIGATPAFAGSATASAVTQLSAGYNTTLFTGLQSAGIRVIPVDTFSFFNEIIAQAPAYGFTNTTGIACGAFPPVTTAQTANSLFCYTGNLVAPGADRNYVFADSVHPTTGSHALLADFVKSLIDGPSQYGMLAEASLRAREAHVHSLADGIATGRQVPAGRFNVFVGGNRADYAIDSATAQPGLESDSKAGTIGLTMRASDSVVIGAAYGGGRNRGTFGAGAGNYEVTEHVWSVFASAKGDWFYGTGVLSIGDTRYSDIKRTVRIGPVTRTAEANTEGNNASAFLQAGMDFPVGSRFKVGPLVSVHMQNVDVNQFDESGAGTANLQMKAQKRKSEVWSAGARASYTMGAWTPWARITADRERRDDDREVSAMPLTMTAIGSTYAVPTYKPDSSYMTWALGLSGLIAPRVGLSLAYYKVESRSDSSEDGFWGTISFGF